MPHYLGYVIMISASVGSVTSESNIPVVGTDIVFYILDLMMGSYAMHPYNAKCDYFDGSTWILFGHLSQQLSVL